MAMSNPGFSCFTRFILLAAFFQTQIRGILCDGVSLGGSSRVIAGVVVGVFALILIIGVTICLWMCKKHGDPYKEKKSKIDKWKAMNQEPDKKVFYLAMSDSAFTDISTSSKSSDLSSGYGSGEKGVSMNPQVHAPRRPQNQYTKLPVGQPQQRSKPSERQEKSSKQEGKGSKGQVKSATLNRPPKGFPEPSDRPSNHRRSSSARRSRVTDKFAPNGGAIPAGATVAWKPSAPVPTTVADKSWARDAPIPTGNNPPLPQNGAVNPSLSQSKTDNIASPHVRRSSGRSASADRRKERRSHRDKVNSSSPQSDKSPEQLIKEYNQLFNQYRAAEPVVEVRRPPPVGILANRVSDSSFSSSDEQTRSSGLSSALSSNGKKNRGSFKKVRLQGETTNI